MDEYGKGVSKLYDELLRVDVWSLIVALLFLNSSIASADIKFEDVSEAAGFSYEGESWGAAWADFDNDGKPDLWVTNHISRPSLYLNNGDGTFLDISEAAIPQEVYAMVKNDAHGAAWADFDNDGDQDLIQLVGSDLKGTGESGPNQFLVNQGNILEELGVEFGLDYAEGRGRMPLWLDANNDGWLDLYNPIKIGSSATPSKLFLRTEKEFIDVTDEAGIGGTIVRAFAFLGDIDDDGIMEMLIEENHKFPTKVVKLGRFPLQNVEVSDVGLPGKGGVEDGVIADLDGDLDNDIFLVRGESNSEVVQVGSSILEGHFGPKTYSERGIKFVTSGDVEFNLRYLRSRFPLWSIHIGSDYQHTATRHLFTLSSSDTTTHGIAEHVPGGVKGIFIGYNPVGGYWEFRVSMTYATVADVFIIKANTPITEFEPVDWDPAVPQAPSDLYYVKGVSGFEEIAQQSGIDIPLSARSVVAGDFDNDMDLDLYAVCTGPVQNHPNVLYENLGDGRFSLVPIAGGAEGDSRGRGDAVAVADYDVDGYLDLFVTNGKSRAPLDLDGPIQLFKNKGSGNHWIELDLEGVLSNRDGIGAIIMLTAGGVTQRREQGAGIHSRAQNHKRLHFGLAENFKVQNLVIKWPSGVNQRIMGIVADQVLQVIEPVIPEVLGQPDMSGNSGVYIWKDGATESYHLRTSAVEKSVYDIMIVVTDGMGIVTPYKLEQVDDLKVTDYGLSLRSVVRGGGEDGVDFQLPNGATALISVERNGVSNPRQLHVGASGLPLSPVGWIKPYQDITPMPGFTAGKDLGLFLGQGVNPSVIEARLSSNGPSRKAGISLISSYRLNGVTPVALENNDSLVQTQNSVVINAQIGSSIDGVDLLVDVSSNIGIVYSQDNLAAPIRVNQRMSNLGTPNAYWLP